jgi:SAM-dependent methyltransferase
VSVDYLNKPFEIFREAARVLKPGGKFILSQSNRCFATKAIAMWLGQSDLQHCQVIGAYFHFSGGWSPARAFDVSPHGSRTSDPLFIVEATKL